MDEAAPEKQALFVPAMAPAYDKFKPYSYAFMRFCTGAVLFPHGVQKAMSGWADKGAENIAAAGLPSPLLLAYLAVFSELIAAACLALGLFTRVAAAMIAIQMAVIIVFFQWKFGYFWTSRGIEYALLLLLLCVAIFFEGGGRYSLDRVIGKEF